MDFDWTRERPVWFAYRKPLVPGIFIERPNRFVAFIEIDGVATRTHVPDPGRLKELLLPGARVYLYDGGDSPTRKTRYSLHLVESPDKASWVSLNTQLPNRLVRMMLQEDLLPHLSGYRLVKPEFTYGKSRFDFLLESRTGKQKRLMEVKSVTLVLEDGSARFPDAPTVRGTRHLRELIAAQAAGYESSVLFVVQRADALSVSPNQETDPDFYDAVRDAMQAGVDFSAICYHLTPEGIELRPGLLPVHLNPAVLLQTTK